MNVYMLKLEIFLFGYQETIKMFGNRYMSRHWYFYLTLGRSITRRDDWKFNFTPQHK